MTGPEHYAEAERLLELAGGDCTPVDMAIRADAQIHATLAVAAATVNHTASRGPGDVGSDWERAVYGGAS